MSNLLPNWFNDWWIDGLRGAGRLFWSVLILLLVTAIIVILIKPPMLKRPVSTRVGVALFGVIIVGTLVLAKIITPWQNTIVWLGILALIAHTFFMVASRPARDPDVAATWAESFAGAVGVFAFMALAYAIVPHEWMTFANANLGWGDTTKFLFQSNQNIFFIPINWPFSFDYPALRDIIVSVIYIVILGANLKLWVMWQHRLDPIPEADPNAPVKRSRFGRPLQVSSASGGN